MTYDQDSARDPALEQSDGYDEEPALIDTDVGRAHLRSEISNYISHVTFPTSGPALRRMASQSGAEEAVWEVLLRLPDEGTYSTSDEVWEALGL